MWDTRTALAEIEGAPGRASLAAEAGGLVVGTCQLIVFRHVQAVGGRCAEIQSVHVRAEWRVRGIGGLLVEEAVARADARAHFPRPRTLDRVTRPSGRPPPAPARPGGRPRPGRRT